MKNLPLFKIVVFYVALGITILLIGGSIIDLVSVGTSGKQHVNFHLFKDLFFLFSAALIIYFSVWFYQKNSEETRLNYQKVFDGCPLAMYIMAKESFKILVVNDAMTKLYGYTADEFHQMTTFDIRPEEEHKRVKNFIDHYDGLINETGVWLHQKKNGKLFYVQTTFHVLPLGKKDAYLVMVTDIDKSINDEKRISDLLHLYEAVNKATHDVIWDYDLKSDKLNWMQGYYEIYGYTNESSQKDFWAMKKIHSDDRRAVISSFKKILLYKEKDWSLEYRYTCANGNVKYIRDKGYVIFDQDNEPVRMIGALQDIDKQKKYEQLLLSQNEQLKEIAWLNSHQVRRPLSNILGLISLIKDPSNSHEEIDQFVDLLAVSSKELNDAVALINRQITVE